MKEVIFYQRTIGPDDDYRTASLKHIQGEEYEKSGFHLEITNFLDYGEHEPIVFSDIEQVEDYVRNLLAAIVEYRQKGKL